MYYRSGLMISCLYLCAHYFYQHSKMFMKEMLPFTIICIIDNFPLAQVFIQNIKKNPSSKHFSLISKSKNIFYTQSLSFSFKSDYQFVSHN